MEVTRNSSAAQPVAETRPVRKNQTQELQQQAAQREQAKPVEQEKPKPVLNTQGQTTGRIVNATA